MGFLRLLSNIFSAGHDFVFVCFVCRLKLQKGLSCMAPGKKVWMVGVVVAGGRQAFPCGGVCGWDRVGRGCSGFIQQAVALE